MVQVLYLFLEFFSSFDWDKYCVSLSGPVPYSKDTESLAENFQRLGTSDCLAIRVTLLLYLQSWHHANLKPTWWDLLSEAMNESNHLLVRLWAWMMEDFQLVWFPFTLIWLHLEACSSSCHEVSYKTGMDFLQLGGKEASSCSPRCSLIPANKPMASSEPIKTQRQPSSPWSPWT